jgi:hypothetical protein
MKSYRIKMVGFGLAALAGSAVAADGEWRPAGQPSSVIPFNTQPAVLPSTVRNSMPVATEPDPSNAFWFPAGSRPDFPPVRFPSEFTGPQTILIPTTASRLRFQSVVHSVGPRIGAVPEFMLPTWVDYSPLLVLQTGPTQLPDIPQIPQKGSELPQPRPVPPIMPQPVPPPAEFLPPHVPDMIPPDLPRQVRPSPPPAAAAAGQPAAPGDQTVPQGGELVPGRWGTFGSMPIVISRDYPSLAELCGFPIRSRLGQGGPGGQGGQGERGAFNNRGFVDGEFLLWWAKGFNIPVIGTTSTNGGFGFLGQPGTVPILGPGTLFDSVRPGFRMRAGMWVDDCHSCAIDGSFFFLGRLTADSTLTSATFPTITRPIFSPNPIPGTGTVIGETGQAVAVPGILAGALATHAESVLWGFDANVRKCLFSCCDTQASWFVGYRNLNISESLAITENINVIGPGGTRVVPINPIGTAVVVQDRFATDNHFNGAQIGATYERRWGRVSLDARASVAVGATHQELNIDGFQEVTQPGLPPMLFRGGLLAAGPNLGSFTRDRFSVAPEATVNLGYWVLPRLKLYAGYNFLYWTNVIRPGDQIDHVVDLTFVPNSPAVAASGQLHPQPQFRQSNLWVTGVQFGLEWRW